MTTRFPCSLAFAALVASATSLSAQCANAWASIGDLPGVDYVVNTVASWDPDGPGPLSSRVAVAGSFAIAGGVAANGVAAWDPATGAWSALGAGATGQQISGELLALPNGDLIAGGAPTSGGAANMLARWNGTTWVPFGGVPASGGMAALARLPNGDLAVGGSFTSVGATVLNYVGVWNGTTWSSLGGGMNALVRELIVMPNGDLVALGDFTIAGGVPANGVARWNGTAWAALGSGFSGSISAYGPLGDAAVVLPNGDLVVGGTFTHAGGVPAPNLARWDGTSWSAFGGGIGGAGYSGIGVRALALLPNSDLVAGGYFMDAGGVPIPNIARWDGSAWSSLGAGIPDAAVNSLAVMPNGDLVAGGTFSVAGGVGASRVARWDGAAWSSFGNGTAPSDYIRSLVTMPDGSVVAGGAFLAAGTVAAGGIARWDGAAWSALGSGFPPYWRVNAMALQPNGDLVVGGTPGFVGRWDGFSWTSLATQVFGGVPHAEAVKAVAVRPNGDIVIGGDFVQVGSTWVGGLARWNGTSWSTLGGQWAFDVQALATLSNGDLVIGGSTLFLPNQANGIARWNGTSWLPLGSGVQDPGEAIVSAIVPLANGALIAGGQFTTAGGLPANNIARWNGTSWSPLGTGTNGAVRTLHVLPNGDVIAAGDFSQAGGVAASRIARWNGTSWSAIGAGVQTSYPTVCAIAALPNGDLLVGGGIVSAGGQPSPNLARLTTTCPATSQSTGAGCSGNVVTSTLPWTGGTWRADGSGLPGSALVCIVHGFTTTSLPLASIFATAVPGCTLRVQPDFVGTTLANAGTTSVQFVLPDSPSLAGTVFHHQMVPLALDGTWAVTATNSLQLTVGSF